MNPCIQCLTGRLNFFFLIFEEYVPNVNVSLRWTVVDTLYNGRCRMLTSDYPMRQGSYHKIVVALGQGPISVFLFQPGLEVSVLAH